MNRWWVGLVVLVVCKILYPCVKGKSLLAELNWEDITCDHPRSGELRLKWGPDSPIEIKIPNFHSVIENETLVYRVSNRQTGAVSFRDFTWWVADPKRHSGSQCSLSFSELKQNPLRFKVAVACKNLLPLDETEGGLTDVSAEKSGEILCH